MLSPRCASDGSPPVCRNSSFSPGGKFTLVKHAYAGEKKGYVITGIRHSAFDESLKSRDPSWGLRDRDAVAAEAKAEGLSLTLRLEMPANNLMLLFRKGAVSN